LKQHYTVEDAYNACTDPLFIVWAINHVGFCPVEERHAIYDSLNNVLAYTVQCFDATMDDEEQAMSTHVATLKYFQMSEQEICDLMRKHLKGKVLFSA